MSEPLTKRNAPRVARIVWDFRQEFGDGVTYDRVTDGDFHIGAPLPPANGAANLAEEG